MWNGLEGCRALGAGIASPACVPGTHAPFARSAEARRQEQAEGRLTRRLLEAWEEMAIAGALPSLQDFLRARADWLDADAFLLKTDEEPALSVFLLHGRSTMEMFGRRLAGATLAATVPSWLREALLDACERCCESHAPQEAEGSWLGSDGARRFRAIVLPLGGAQQTVGYLLGAVSRGGAEDGTDTARLACAGLPLKVMASN